MALEIIGTILLGILGIGVLIAYIYTLVQQAKKEEWVWFILTLIFPVVLIVYWILRLSK